MAYTTLEEMVVEDSPYVYLPVGDTGTEHLGSNSPTVTMAKITISSDGVDGGKAYNFPKEAGQWVWFADAPLAAGSDLTVEWWMKSDTSGANSVRPVYMYSGSTLFNATFDSTTDGPLSITYGGYPTGAATVNTGVNVNDGEWHHVVVTVENLVMKVYVDGVLTGTANATSLPAIAGTISWFIGQSGTGKTGSNMADRLFGGLIDHFAMYTHALPEERVVAHYNWATGGVSANIEAYAASATATAMAVEPEFYGVPLVPGTVAVYAPPATATAMAVEPEFGTVAVDAAVADAAMPGGYATETLVAVRVLASSVSGGGVTGTTASEVSIDGFWGGTVIADLPDLDSVKDKPQDQVKTLVLTIKNTYAYRPNGSTAFNAKAVKRVNGVDSDVGAVTAYTMGDTISVTVPYEAGLQGLGVVVPSTGVAGHKVRFDNPANDTLTESYYTVYIDVDSGAFPEAAPAKAFAGMVNPDVDTVKGALHGAAPALATATMPGGRFPHNNVNAAPATATATMGASWFKSNRTVAADVMDVSVEALEIAGVSAGRNISVAVQPAVMHNAWIVNPMEVNEGVSDPYWNRVVGRSDAGSKPPRATTWLRFNERSGELAHTTSGTTGLKNATGLAMEGVYEWGHPAPNGKRALKVIAMERAGNTGDGAWFDLTTGASVELTLRVEPGHTGRMDIANGRDVSFQSSSNPADLNISVRDGRLYAATNLGGASLQRIDDGKWHHIVVTSASNAPRFSTGGIDDTRILQIWIDGKLDRNITKATGETPYGWYSWSGAHRMAAPRRWFGWDTGFPFQGEILDFVYRRAQLASHEIQDLYLDMFGHMAARASVITAGQGEMFQGHRVESNMKRMLMLTWRVPETFNSMWPGFTANDPMYDRSVAIGVPRNTDPNNAKHLSPMGMYKNLGAGRYEGAEEWDLGRFLISYQPVNSVGIATTEEAKAANPDGIFRDPKTGRRRLVNLQTDLNLDEFDVIAFQAYPNPQHDYAEERQAYEAFFGSVKQAMVDGHKFWITDAYLAADLGLVTDVEYVPTMGRMLGDGRISNIYGNDVRGYEVFPTVGANGVSAADGGRPAAKNGPSKVEKPQDGSLPRLPTGLSWGSQGGPQNMWRYDLHQNNGWRVINEIEGLTDIPSWELDELAGREKAHMFAKNLQWEQWAYRLKNRSGEDLVWKYELNGEEKTLVKPSERVGLRAGDEFYDYVWFSWMRSGFSLDDPFDSISKRRMRVQKRALGTWAIPPGHLKAGVPVTTFRSTTWNDYGDEVTNPFKDFVRTAVIRPGDRLPDGRKVNGAVFMEFAEHPVWSQIWGHGILKQLTRAPGDPVPNSQFAYSESDYSFDWDYNTHGRFSYTGGGQADLSNRMLRFTWDRDKNGELIPQWEYAEEPLPIAQDISELYPITYVPNWTWNGRGLAWLLGLGRIDAEYSVTLGETMRASAEMRSPMVSTEFDNEVTVGAAVANGRAVDPEEATIKNTQVMAFPATASGRMLGLQGGYKAQAATAYAMMPQNVLRPLDVEEVLFFTVSFTQKTIYLRMEEN